MVIWKLCIGDIKMFKEKRIVSPATYLWIYKILTHNICEIVDLKIKKKVSLIDKKSN